MRYNPAVTLAEWHYEGLTMASFRFGDRIGGGSFGVVKEAVRVEDGLKVAAKFLADGTSPDDLKRFKREVRMQMQMNHQNVVPILGKNETVTPPWFIMPRALLNLCDYLKSDSGEGEVWLFEHIAEGIQHAHENGVIHRDLKPANVLLFRDDDGDLFAAVADFGLGKMLDRDTMTITYTGAQVGTPAYFAPEQYHDGKNADERSDVFALGKLLYEILTGDIPYPSMDFARVPRKFVYIIRKATSDDPDRRYQSVSTMLDDFRLVTRKHQSFAPVSQTVREMLEDLSAKRRLNASDLDDLARTLGDNADDPQLLLRVVPHVPDPVLKVLLTDHLDTFQSVLEAYDAQIAEGVTFEYCDEVADFYENVFGMADDAQPKTLVLRRLPSLGTYNNRWHVGHALAHLLDGLDDPELIMAARDAVCENPQIADWCDQYFDDIDLPQVIRRAINETK
jgi:eukaryotic-like serine/threonine-protein kinase